MTEIKNILNKPFLEKEDLVALLSRGQEDARLLFEKSREVKLKHVGNKVYFRGLIEYSNICGKNCYYCGVRAGNRHFVRYTLSEEEVLESARYAWENNFASIVIQSGERTGKVFTSTITRLLRKIMEMTKGELHVTLSLGEQSEETYREWYENGAHRYLLRIEVSDPELYARLHPANARHSHARRLACLQALKQTGYQVGTGVMIGLPFQTPENLAGDLLFFRELDVDMVGMGPYIEHERTPLYRYRDLLLPLQDRFDLSLKMVALLRILMKDINIAATTAMQTIDPQGREKAIMVGANVVMPNLTPVKYHEKYLLYQNKPCLDEEADECQRCLEARIQLVGDEIGYGEWGDSLHYAHRKKHL